MPETPDDDLRKVLREFRTSVSKEFASIDERFQQVDARFQQVDARFQQVDARFQQVDARFDRLEGRMDGLEGRMTELTHEVRTRTTTMETAILNSIRDLAGEMTRRFDDHDRRLRRLEE